MTHTPIEVILTKEICAPVSKVFDAWTKPELIKQWFAPSKIMTVPKAEVNLSPGGEYLIHMHNPEDKTDHIVSGAYEEVIVNEKIVFTWMWRDGVDRTQVTVEFKELANEKTMLTLTHRGFSSQEFADKHTMGWNGCLENLGSFYA